MKLATIELHCVCLLYRETERLQTIEGIVCLHLIYIPSEGHRSIVVTVARLESGICKDPGFATASVHLIFFVLRASETGLLLVVKLGRNVVMKRAGVKIMHQSNARRP